MTSKMSTLYFCLFLSLMSPVISVDLELDDNENTFGFEFSPLWDDYFDNPTALIDGIHSDDLPSDFNPSEFTWQKPGHNETVGIWAYLAQLPPTPTPEFPSIKFRMSFQLIQNLTITCYVHGSARVDVKIGDGTGDPIKTILHADTPTHELHEIFLDFNQAPSVPSNAFVLEIHVPDGSTSKDFFFLDKFLISWGF